MQYADYGLNVNRGNVKYVVEFIQRQEQSHTPRIVHEGVGFDTVTDKDTGEVTHLFKHSKCIGMKSSYVGAYDIAPTGGMRGFRAFLHENVYGTPLQLAVVVGLAGVLVGFHR
jgi:hypothetical protein